MTSPTFEHYRFEVTPLADDDGGGHLVSFPDLPGCMSDGESADEAIKNARDAFDAWIAAQIKEGREIPRPGSEAKKPAKFVLRLPRNLHERLSAAANNEGVSANTLVTTFVAEGLARRDTADVPASTSSPNDLHFKSAYELRDLVRSYMQRFSAGRRDTDDLVQEVYVRVLKHGRTDPPIADYRKYLFALTRQVASDYLRRDIRKNVLHTAEDADDIEIIDKGPTPEDIVESLSRQQVLMKVLQQLPPRVRAVMSLRAGGLNNKQIAKELGLSITTVEKHQESALRKLGQPAPK